MAHTDERHDDAFDESQENSHETSHVDDSGRALEIAEAKADENWNLYLRARAELENERKRWAREREKIRKFANTELVEALLPVRDNLELGLLSARSADAESLREGVELTLRSFDSVLMAQGVEEVPSEGEVFDPEVHEAIAVESSGEYQPNTVVEVHQKGYLLNGRLVRPARVTVSQARGVRDGS